MEWNVIQNLLVKEWKVDEEDDENRRGEIQWTTSSSIASGAGSKLGPWPGKSYAVTTGMTCLAIVKHVPQTE